MLAASRGLDGSNASSPAGNTQKVMSPGGNVEKVVSSGGAGAPSVSSDLVAAAVAEEVRPKHDGWSRIRIRSEMMKSRIRRRKKVVLVTAGCFCLATKATPLKSMQHCPQIHATLHVFDFIVAP